MSDPVPAIAEAAATGKTAALFADIRKVYGVNVVNLIWRHLATIDGALAHVWGAVRPLYADGTIAREAKSLRADLAVPAAPEMPRCVLESAGLAAEDRHGIGRVMAAYDRTNAMALLALSAARARLAGQGGSPWRPGQEGPPPEASLVLPPLLDLAALAPETAALVTALNRMGSDQAEPVLASMWRNLAHWPQFLALAWPVLAPLHADGRLVRAVAGGLALARSRAASLPCVAQVPPLDPALVPQVDAALAQFTGDAIARMLIVTRVLRAAFGDALR
jgi:hypothetical protein